MKHASVALAAGLSGLVLVSCVDPYGASLGAYYPHGGYAPTQRVLAQQVSLGCHSGWVEPVVDCGQFRYQSVVTPVGWCGAPAYARWGAPACHQHSNWWGGWRSSWPWSRNPCPPPRTTVVLNGWSSSGHHHRNGSSHVPVAVANRSSEPRSLSGPFGSSAPFSYRGPTLPDRIPGAWISGVPGPSVPSARTLRGPASSGPPGPSSRQARSLLAPMAHRDSSTAGAGSLSGAIQSRIGPDALNLR